MGMDRDAAVTLERVRDVRPGTRTARSPANGPWWIAARGSWGSALFAYLLPVRANRIGYTVLSIRQLKILQEVITLAVFAPFALLYRKQALTLDFLWPACCMIGAVYFMVRSQA